MYLLKRNLTVVTVLLALSGCMAGGIASMDEASELSRQALNTPPKKPYQTVEELKAVFNDTIEPINCTDFAAKRKQQKEKVIANLKSDSKTNIKGAAALASWLSEIDVKRGQLNEAEQIATAAYNLLPSSGESVRKSVLSNNILRIHAYKGDVAAANNWHSVAIRNGKQTGKGWSKGHVGNANRYTSSASLAALEGNLLAEEYYLKQSLNSVWYGKSDMKVGINSEYIFARLAENLLLQNRPLEAEYVARIYLFRLKEYSTPKAYYPLLMQKLSKAFLAQGKLEDAKWAATRAIEGHVNICSVKRGTPFMEAKEIMVQTLTALGDEAAISDFKQTYM